MWGKQNTTTSFPFHFFAFFTSLMLTIRFTVDFLSQQRAIRPMERWPGAPPSWKPLGWLRANWLTLVDLLVSIFAKSRYIQLLAIHLQPLQHPVIESLWELSTNKDSRQRQLPPQLRQRRRPPEFQPALQGLPRIPHPRDRWGLLCWNGSEPRGSRSVSSCVCPDHSVHYFHYPKGWPRSNSFSVGKLVRTTGEIPINYCGLMAHPGVLGPNGRFLNNFVECGWLGEVAATFGWCLPCLFGWRFAKQKEEQNDPLIAQRRKSKNVLSSKTWYLALHL